MSCLENNDFIDINSIIGNSNDSSKENVDNVIEIDNDQIKSLMEKRDLIDDKIGEYE